MENLDIFFNRVEITIVNCPPGLNGAQVEYTDSSLMVFGVVENEKLVVETADEIPDDAVIVWGKGTWTISW